MPLSIRSIKRAGVGAATHALTERAFTELRQLHYNRQARNVLASIERQRGPTDRALLRQADDYAREVLGSAKYAPWLHVYAAVSNTFKEGWIPDNYYGLVVEPMKGGDAARVVLLKSFTHQVLRTAALPDLAYVIDGNFYARDYRLIRAADLDAILFAQDEAVYFKADNSYQGRSVTPMTRRDLQDLASLRLPDGVFQAPIRQHDVFEAICPSATATLRITTTREPDGSIGIRAAYLRVGRATDRIVTSRSHVRIAVNHDTGVLDDVGYLHDWQTTDRHPDTGFRFAGQVIPGFADAVHLCRSLHEGCPHMLCLGWDVCIDRDDRVQLIEWNARYNDIKFSEATVGPCFRGLGWESLWKRAAAPRQGDVAPPPALPVSGGGRVGVG